MDTLQNKISVATFNQKNMMNQHADITSLNSIISLYMFIHPLRCDLEPFLIIHSKYLLTLKREGTYIWYKFVIQNKKSVALREKHTNKTTNKKTHTTNEKCLKEATIHWGTISC